MKRITVLLADDNRVVRTEFRKLLELEDDLEVVGEAKNGLQAVALVKKLRPDVVLMDIAMPLLNGLEATRQIVDHFPETKVVMLTSFADEELVMSAIRAGAVGYLLKEVGNEEVLRGIRAAAQGNSVMDAATTSRLFARVRTAERKEEEDAFRDLTGREMAVLFEVGQGKTNAEIAQNLNLSEKTARNYVSAILEKLHLSNRIELATYSVKYHLSERMKRE